MNDEEFVRLRAYQLWVQEGRPEGREHVHWHRARSELGLTGSEPQRARDAPAAAQQAGENPKEEP